MSALSLTLDDPVLAARYEQVSRDRQFLAGQALIAQLALAAGERVLDVGSGTGLLAEHVAGIVGDHGRVVGIDPLANFYRVLAPGGRLGISTGSKDHVSPLQVIRKRVLAREPFRAYPESSAGFAQRVNRAELQALLTQAGFVQVEVQERPHVQHQPSVAAAIDFAQSSSFGNFLGHLPAQLAARARAEIAAELAPLETSEGLRQESVRLVAVAVKPAAPRANAG